MPKTSAAKLTAKEKEKGFINFYVEAGAVESSISECERRAHIRAGVGRKILKKKWAKDVIKAKMEVVRREQFRQEVIGEAAKLATVQVQEQLSAKVDSIQRMKIDLEVLDHELMMMAVGLEKNQFPKEKLDAIKAAYVVFGTLESGNTRRLIPPEHLQQNDGQGTYTSLFDRLALKSSSDAALQSSASAKDDVYDLTPQSSISAPLGQSFPSPGEAIDDSPSLPKPKSPNVITVEVG